MVIVMEAEADQQYVNTVIARIEELGYTPNPIYGTERTVVAAIGINVGC